MEAFIAAFSEGVDAVDSFVWGWAMIVFLLGTHLIMTVRTGFIQRKIGTAIKLSVSKSDSDAEGDVCGSAARAPSSGCGSSASSASPPSTRKPTSR